MSATARQNLEYRKVVAGAYLIEGRRVERQRLRRNGRWVIRWCILSETGRPFMFAATLGEAFDYIADQVSGASGISGEDGCRLCREYELHLCHRCGCELSAIEVEQYHTGQKRCSDCRSVVSR